MKRKIRKGRAKKHDSSSLANVKNALRGARDLAAALSRLRTTVPAPAFAELIDWIRGSHPRAAQIFHPRYPRTLAQLKNTPVLRADSPQREIRWAGACILKEERHLRRYLTLRHSFQESILLDDFIRGTQSLNAIETDLGHSLWLITNRLALLATSDGLDAQKQYATSVKAAAPHHGIAAFVAHYVSVRNENAVTPGTFSQVFASHLRTLDLAPGLARYLSHHVLPEFTTTRNDIRDILRHESSGPVVDCYESLVRTMRIAITSDYSDLDTSFIAALEFMREADPRVAFLLSEARHDPPPQVVDGASISAFEELVTGHYQEATATSTANLSRSPTSFDDMEVSARALAILEASPDPDSGSLLRRLVARMCLILRRIDDPGRHIVELTKVALNFNRHEWADALLGFIKRETAVDPFVDLAGNWFCVVGMPVLHPIRQFNIGASASRVRYAESLRASLGSRNAVQYAACLSEPSTTGCSLAWLPEPEAAILDVHIKYRAATFDAALAAAQTLLSSPLSYFRDRSVHLSSVCLLALGRTEELVDLIATVGASGPRLLRLMPVSKTIPSLSKDFRTRHAPEISVPVFYDIASKHLGPDVSALRSYAYEDFLTAHGLRRPSELRALEKTLDRRKLIYFLREVCVESVMDCSLAFKTSRDVKNERIAVCRLLTDLDPANVDHYHDEIKDLLGRLLLQKKMRELEQSKIYVDIDGIRRAATDTIKENFDRYMSFVKQGLTTVHAIEDEAHPRTPEDNAGKLVLPRDEVVDLFDSIVLKLRDDFISSTEHGLDGYLSVRIRHGTLSGQLRRALENSHLITQRDPNGQYRRNDHWLSRLNIHDGVSHDAIDAELRLFAQKFDDLVRMILSEWIQVRKDSAGKGLFDFSLTLGQTKLLSRLVKADTTLDQFVSSVVQAFNELLDVHLDTIRDRLSDEAKPRANQLLTELQAYFERLGDQNDTRDIVNALGVARTEMQIAFDRVVEWFRRSGPGETDPVRIQDAINIGLESVRAISRGLECELSLGDSTLYIYSRQLAGFVDIFFIIFENIVRHSQAAEIPRANLAMTYEDSRLRFVIENEIAADVASEERRGRVSEIQTAIQQKEETRRFVGSEGGTGFHKIRKILSHDFGVRDPRLAFGFRSAERFFVEFEMPVRGEEQDENTSGGG